MINTISISLLFHICSAHLVTEEPKWNCSDYEFHERPEHCNPPPNENRLIKCVACGTSGNCDQFGESM